MRYDAVVRMRGDSRLSIDFQIAPLFAEDGTISHLVVSGLDLTPRKSAEAALEAALEKEARGRARAELLARVLSDVESAGTVDQQLQRLADLLVPQVADFVSVEAPAERDHLLVVRHVDPGKVETLRTLRLRHRLGPEHPSSMWNVSKGRPQTRTEATAGEHQLDQTTAELLERLGVSSHVAVPLALGAGVEGSLLCGLSRGERRPYDDEDLAFVAEIAERVGLIVAANRAREREHAFSLRLQKALLPERLRIHPEIDVVARYEAASDQLEVGGDWYDTFVWPGGEYGVVVGDVVGHGIEAAAAMGRLRAAGGILIMAGPPDPAAILDVLDRCARGPDGVAFATAFCAVVDPTDRVLRYASAGHPPALLLRADGTSGWLDRAPSPAICSIEGARRTSASVDLEPDDVVLCYSDGLVERRGEALNVGLERLRIAAADLIECEVDELARRILASLDDGFVEDDTVVVALRFASSAPRFTAVVEADTGELAPLRAGLRPWLDEQGVTGTIRHDVLLGLGEACANAIEHAYPDRKDGDVAVSVSRRDRRLTVRVKDRGTWAPPVKGPHDRGRGLLIMASIATQFFRDSGPTGTTVSMTFELPPAEAPDR